MGHSALLHLSEHRQPALVDPLQAASQALDQCSRGSRRHTPETLTQKHPLFFLSAVYLFKFTDALRARSDDLAERKKSDILSAEEEAELTGLLELDRIFTLLNAKIIADS